MKSFATELLTALSKGVVLKKRRVEGDRSQEKRDVPKPRVKPNVDLLKKQINDGMTSTEIANIQGCHAQTVRNTARDLEGNWKNKLMANGKKRVKSNT
jgi:DNA invertase Pin-like site-specific DNA recombinase